MKADIEEQANIEPPKPPKFRPLGSFSTIGELRKAIEKYPDDTSLGFRNQPTQELFEVGDSERTFVAFQEQKGNPLMLPSGDLRKEWEKCKEGLKLKGTAGEMGTYFGMFMHGWKGRGLDGFWQ
jgi:hypothetical protein